ncbi:two-component system QseEF-associated lipoprotein QseG [Rahnella woolbedingensis]|uniref:Two-component system QseEF-associated lipoprotein QseG n=1 Tax=Rahnella woolbedingensis TaxID=1510574 RepID=A0A419NCK1_9GAMM|nr:two-component system QseEF-associated lipoprotein QseG [Rahnella woolbedingensis]RJT46071.1 two-component system QseEF-associated lipoprotein QseG [Rahnella woolbedingensis]
MSALSFITPITSRLLRAVLRSRVLLLTAPLALAACVPHSPDNRYYQQVSDQVVPDSKVIDFRIAPCETLWTLDDNEAVTNSLYWLRAMDCADRMNDAQARFQAQQIPATTWDQVFKQSILLSGAEPDQQQRRALLAKVSAYRGQMPGQIRPLVQLWRERQNLQVVLGDEKARNARQLAVSEEKLQAMTQQQQVMESNLADTRRKLENLTDIERQLSSRKQIQGDLPDNDAAVPARAVPGNPVKPAETYTPPAKDPNAK